MHTESEVISIVNEVVETLNERVEGYQRAAAHVKDPTIENIFHEYASQGKNFLLELEPFTSASSEEIGKGPLGMVYQGWMNLKEKITGYNTKSIIGDCITGEEAALRIYEGAMKDEELPSELRKIFARQFIEISSAQDRLKDLRGKF